MCCSNNVDKLVAKNISLASEYSLTKDFGKYLRVLILHNRMSKNIYRYLEEQVQK